MLRGDKSEQLLGKLLENCQSQGLVKARGKQRTDSAHVLGAIRDMNLCECVGETLRHTLNELSMVAPGWVQTVVSQEFYLVDNQVRLRTPRAQSPNKQVK